ncbi:MAG: hypothetical protein KC964_23495 [Candidatus Omnitrophica bacterium]|nr:hypothetical protein [Candidatus Omnitrophota bacterium]
MGYDLHITRAEEWIYNEGREISKEEWLAYVESDPELSLVPENGDCFADWNVDLPEGQPWFDWWRGNIYTKNPTRPVIEKMLEIAEAFDAHVQGDDDEIYPDCGMPDDEPVEIPEPTKGPVGPVQRTFLRFVGFFWFRAGDLRLGDRVKMIQGGTPGTIVSIVPFGKYSDRMVDIRFDSGNEFGIGVFKGDKNLIKIE